MGISDRKKSIDVSVNINLDFNEEIRPNNFIVENNFKSGFFVSRKKSGNIIAGSKLNVEGQGIFTVKGGDNINITKHFPKPTPVSDGLKPTPTPTPTNTPTNTQTPSITPTNTQTPSITPTNTVTPTPTNTVTPTKTPTPTITTSALPITNPEAFAYASQVIAAGGSIDYTTALALDTLFNDLQGNNTQAGPTFYSVLEGFYPMLGLTSATQAINANGNDAADLNIFGGWTFNSMGMKGNGINSVVNISRIYGLFSPYDLQNTHFSIYGTLPYNTPSNRADLALIDPSTPNMDGRISLNDLNFGAGDEAYYEYNVNTTGPVYAPLGSGSFVVMSNDGTYTYSYQNGNSLSTFSESPVLYNTPIIYLGLSRFSSVGVISTNRYGWVSFGGFMSSADMGNYQTIVNTFMTSIGRNTY
jgi:hypothetical protein